MQTSKPIIILCEGLSEEAYIICLNRFLNSQQNSQIRFVPKVIGRNRLLSKQLKKIRLENRNTKYIIWIDGDVFKRKKSPLPKIPNGILCLNTYSFEDFLVMHLDKKIVMKWQRICSDLGHFHKPMTSDTCIKNIVAIFPKYRKGSMPINFEISVMSLKKLFNNQSNSEILFSSDFVVFLKKIIGGSRSY